MNPNFFLFTVRLFDLAIENCQGDPVTLAIEDFKAAVIQTEQNFSSTIRLTGVAQMFVAAGYLVDASRGFGIVPEAEFLNAMAQALSYVAVAVETMTDPA